VPILENQEFGAVGVCKNFNPRTGGPCALRAVNGAPSGRRTPSVRAVGLRRNITKMVKLSLFWGFDAARDLPSGHAAPRNLPLVADRAFIAHKRPRCVIAGTYGVSRRAADSLLLPAT
jgi:hypothetical protein